MYVLCIVHKCEFCSSTKKPIKQGNDNLISADFERSSFSTFLSRDFHKKMKLLMIKLMCLELM